MANGHQLNLRLPIPDWEWLESHPGLTAQDVLRALVRDGRERDVKISVNVLVTAEATA